MIDKLFEHTYLINLEKSTDRLNSAKIELGNKNINFERWNAIDGDITEIPFIGIETDSWNKRAAALILTTIEILKDAKSKGYKSILIFEDDVKIHPCYDEIASSIKIPTDWELFHFALTNSPTPKWVSKHVGRIDNSWCCQAYAINEKVYDLMIEDLEKLEKPLDSTTIHIQSRGFSYATITNIITHDVNYSTIRHRVLNHNLEN